MRGSVLLVVASLGVATILSMFFWMARKITWRRPASPLRRLESLSHSSERSGPSSGIYMLDPVDSDYHDSLSPSSAPDQIAAANKINANSNGTKSQEPSPQTEKQRIVQNTAEAPLDLPAASER